MLQRPANFPPFESLLSWTYWWYSNAIPTSVCICCKLSLQVVCWAVWAVSVFPRFLFSVPCSPTQLFYSAVLIWVCMTPRGMHRSDWCLSLLQRMLLPPILTKHLVSAPQTFTGFSQYTEGSENVLGTGVLSCSLSSCSQQLKHLMVCESTRGEIMRSCLIFHT